MKTFVFVDFVGPGLIFVGEVAAMAKSDSKITTNQHNVPTSETHTRSVA